jgi:hypothetical protein
VTSYYLDEDEQGETQWQRFVVRVTGTDTYVELLSAQTGDGWQKVAEFTFARVPED